jgi:hypothetical protein
LTLIVGSSGWGCVKDIAVTGDHRISRPERFAIAAPGIPVTGETMNDALKIRSAALSRRSVLRNFGFTAGGALMLATTVSGNRVAAAQTKMTQKAVGYQETPKGAQRCDNCTQFGPPASCKIVDGSIDPAGWCKVYAKKVAAQ